MCCERDVVGVRELSPLSLSLPRKPTKWQGLGIPYLFRATFPFQLAVSRLGLCNV